MHRYKKLTQDMYWVGGSDRRSPLFESAHPTPYGMSYNSYFIDDQKTVLLDTVDNSVSGVFFENLAALLGDRTLDYVIVNHVEPDHSATLGELVLRYPEVKIVCNSKSKTMINQFFGLENREYVLVQEGGSFETGRHTFRFLMAPMVHWPEVMVTYDQTDKVLYSADAFGTFGALPGNIYADELEFETRWLAEARRYYANIVGKYGPQVSALLKKINGLDIALLCPLHGPIWRNNIGWYIEKYTRWSSYTPEDNEALIIYSSVYGNTANAADILAGELADRGIKTSVYDASIINPSYLAAECFRCSHLVFASTTYNAGLFVSMEILLNDLKAHNLQNRTVALIENGSWAPAAGTHMKNIISGMKNMTVLEPAVLVKSSVKDDQREQLAELAEKLAGSMKVPPVSGKVDATALFKLSYGLFVVSAKQGERENGCITNTVMQVTVNPTRIIITINKESHTHDMIKNTGRFNVSILATNAPFELFKRFGFKSGRDTDKLAGFENIKRSENGIFYVTDYTNAFISAQVVSERDCGTHTEFLADVCECEILSDLPSMTYQYYFDNVKPKPQQPKKKGFVCKICGYVYEGETLPEDFICPICKHGAADFEPLS